MAEVLEALQIDTVAMANNLEQTGGRVLRSARAFICQNARQSRRARAH